MKDKEVLLNEVISRGLDDIRLALLKRKFNFISNDKNGLIASKTTLRGYNIVIEFEEIKGTKFYRMFTCTKGADREFKKLAEILI